MAKKTLVDEVTAKKIAQNILHCNVALWDGDEEEADELVRMGVKEPDNAGYWGKAFIDLREVIAVSQDGANGEPLKEQSLVTLRGGKTLAVDWDVESLTERWIEAILNKM